MRILSLLIVVTILLTTTAFADGQIDIAYSPYTISKPGAYIVVTNLTTAQNLNCITIATSDVTIDLNGHTLYGAGTATGSSVYGIYGSAAQNDITVTNGVVRDFRQSGVYFLGSNVDVSHVKSIQNRIFGIYMANNGVVKNNIAEGNLSDGIRGDTNCTITGNSARSNGGNGIRSSFSGVITGNSSYSNSGDGIFVSDGGCVVIGNSAMSNIGNGIYAYVGNTIKDNTVMFNTGDGIQVTAENQVIGNTCDRNGYGAATAAGIHTTNADNKITDNLLTLNKIGLLLEGFSNFYASNLSKGNTLSQYSTVGSQTDEGATDPALTNFYAQPNFLVQQFAGFEIPVLHDSPNTVIRQVIW